MPDPALPPVVVDGVHKRFAIPREQVSTLKERALHPFRRAPTDVLQALRGVSFAVRPGEFFGIVGRNGSGKSTLLKCLAGIYRVDGGKIYVNGRMSTFIELGVGFNPDLPARDNAMLNATMLGLSPREARNRFDSVIDFAELREFVDLKIKNYSSGMLVRLAFSVMIHVDAEILLIDEVLAVGDASFQQKCYDEFERIRRSGATVLFVTHDMSAVQRFCDRALLLEHGRAVELGDPERVGNRYLELNFSQAARYAEELAAAAEARAAGEPLAPTSSEQAVAYAEEQAVAYAEEHPGAATGEQRLEPGAGDEHAEAHAGAPAGQAAALESEPPPASESEHAGERRLGDGRAEILEAWFENERGERAQVLPTGQGCTFVGRVRFLEEMEDPLMGINVHNSHRDHVLSASNMWCDPRPGVFRAGEEVSFRIGFQNVLSSDRYHVTVSVARRGGAWIDRRERMVSVVVTGTHGTDALVELPFQMTIERAGAPVGSPEMAR